MHLSFVLDTLTLQVVTGGEELSVKNSVIWRTDPGDHSYRSEHSLTICDTVTTTLDWLVRGCHSDTQCKRGNSQWIT